jgi:hypothetical protein
MRVFSSIRGTVKDGRIEEAAALAGEAAKLVGRHGGDVRLFLVTAGDEADTTLCNIEYESPEAMGRAFDKLNTDPELAAFSSRVKAQGSPTVIGSESIGMEVPNGRTAKPGRGSIIEVHSSTPKPGRMEQVVVESAEVCEFVEAHGAVNARLVQLTYAGPMSGLTALTWEHESWAAHAKVSDAWFSKAGLALQAKFLNTDPPSVPIGGALYSEIPL